MQMEQEGEKISHYNGANCLQIFCFASKIRLLYDCMSFSLRIFTKLAIKKYAKRNFLTMVRNLAVLKSFHFSFQVKFKAPSLNNNVN